MKVLIGLLLAYAGMVALCLAMNRHYRQVFGDFPGSRLQLGLRAAGTLVLLQSLAVSISQWGWTIGPTACFGLLTVAALLLVFLLPYVPRFVLLSGSAGLVAGLIGTVLLFTV